MKNRKLIKILSIKTLVLILGVLLGSLATASAQEVSQELAAEVAAIELERTDGVSLETVMHDESGRPALYFYRSGHEMIVVGGDRSILKQAFEGRLLSEAEVNACKQSPDYEPASELLARIERNRKEKAT